ncbi:MAG TPA: MarR family transcriptional regulator [Streptosporangiaceae bacterium]
MTQQSDEKQLDLEFLDALAGLFARLLAEAEQLAKDYGVPAFFLKALHLIDGPLAMKELGQRMHCDPSFVTSIADMLEKRGLAVRESDPADRRVKRLVLTSAGLDMKHQMEQAMLDRSPWRQYLTQDERAILISLIHKMAPPLSATPAADCPAGEVSNFLATAATPPVG